MSSTFIIRYPVLSILRHQELRPGKRNVIYLADLRFNRYYLLLVSIHDHRSRVVTQKILAHSYVTGKWLFHKNTIPQLLSIPVKKPCYKRTKRLTIDLSACRPDALASKNTVPFTADMYLTEVPSFSNDRIPLNIFDGFSYLSRYPDVMGGIQSGRIESAYDHYIAHGIREDRQIPLSLDGGQNAGTWRQVAQRFFDERAYLKANPDVTSSIRAGVTRSGHDHYVEFGRAEERWLPTIGSLINDA